MTALQREFTLVRDFDAPRELVYRVPPDVPVAPSGAPLSG